MSLYTNRIEKCFEEKICGERQRERSKHAFHPQQATVLDVIKQN
jgi:hypothetical protein